MSAQIAIRAGSPIARQVREAVAQLEASSRGRHPNTAAQHYLEIAAAWVDSAASTLPGRPQPERHHQGA